MLGRRIGVLLLFAAVFWMHVLSLVVVDSAPVSGAPAASSVAMSASDMLANPGSHGATDGDQPGNRSAAAPLSAEQPAHQKAPAHEGAAHVWAACLAVLFAVLTVLGAGVFRRAAVPSLRGAASSVRWPVWLPRPRPPDLFALCVLRI